MSDLYRREAEYWQARAEALEKRLNDLRRGAEIYDLASTPPEPPVGTKYLSNEDKEPWRRTEEGWFCPRENCSNCPEDWMEVWDRYLSNAGYLRVLPTVEMSPVPDDPLQLAIRLEEKLRDLSRKAS